MLDNPARKYPAAHIIDYPQRTWPVKRLQAPPRWCSTDLRDGNQALANPMDAQRKLTFFKHLIACGFKEIEVAFPAASEVDFAFVRLLIEENHIPEDVTIQVMTPARPDLIERTIVSLNGASKAIVHVYNATAPIFREMVFQKDKAELIALATAAAKQVRQLCEQSPQTDWTLQYSPETFCFTEADFALEICEAVAQVWGPEPKRPLILNLPTTVEVNTPNVFADQVEHLMRSFSDLKSITISVHPHNDRGTGVATAEMAMLAGAQRVEGCLFGNGERTGNVDLVTLAMNLYTQGVHPQLQFANIRQTVEIVEQCNQLPVHPRHPYGGSLVFTAFSGSHQDAIKKGFAHRARLGSEAWHIPYLPLDPQDVGCSYEEVIRVNSQSGKSGAAWLLQENHGLRLPRALQVDFSQHVQQQTEQTGKEISQAQVWQLFRSLYGVLENRPLSLLHYTSEPRGAEQHVTATLRYGEETLSLQGQGCGLLSALSDGVQKAFDCVLNIMDYQEHTLGPQSSSNAISYIQIASPSSAITHFGVAIETDASKAALQALLNAVADLIRE
ncbi:2-isopropylmalate synthase [Marinomonas gallaica]|uniref:2-isopropylmalate synthase n=1 Tax=Marinomonas gallaica TaxID=1806667 RepID=A0A1C3JRD5_9GAMM|nr:2-isopropylmalate synthase [Marinomonas gallaica]SBT17610.1 2-isopropylmalate synthase [Marinomonas gallaica]SBT19936.1 2-isopropylmalate synthase [Marinomonas gallaica]